MKLKHLQSALSSIPTPQFPSPNITLEQYGTSPELTSHVIQTALMNDDIGPGMSVLDLGCGTGMLSIGSGLVETPHIICVDCDQEAIEIARENVRAMELEDADQDEDCYDHEDGEGCEGEPGCRIEYLLAKVKHTKVYSSSNNPNGGRGRGSGRGRGRSRGGKGKGGRGSKGSRYLERELQQQQRQQWRQNDANDATGTNNIGDDDDDGIPLKSKSVDTVLTNPPFGTKDNAGIDMTFLRTAIRLARRSVYSFHKSSTRSFLVKTVEDWGYEVQVIAQMKFDIPKMYKFHTKDNVEVEVDLIRVSIV